MSGTKVTPETNVGQWEDRGSTERRLFWIGAGILVVMPVVLLPILYLAGATLAALDPTIIVVSATWIIGASIYILFGPNRVRYYTNRPIVVTRGMHPTAVQASVVAALGILGLRYEVRAGVRVTNLPLIVYEQQFILQERNMDVGVYQSVDAKLPVKTVVITIGGWSETNSSGVEALKREIRSALQRTISPPPLSQRATSANNP